MAKKQAGVKTKNLNGKGTREEAGIEIEINKSKVINGKSEWQTNPEGAGKIKKSKQRVSFTESQ